MKKPEWPGITAAVGVLLLVAIAMDLSKWQQLMTGIIAFGGGLLAYRGAMAKVDHDRKIADREYLRRQLAIVLQTEGVLEELLAQVRVIADYFIFEPEADSPYEFVRADFKLDDQPEIEQIWASLDVFPRKLIQEIYTIRRIFPVLQRAVGKIDPDDIIVVEALNDEPWVTIKATSEMIANSATIIIDGLQPLIDELAPELDEAVRHEAIWGPATGP